jgi:hypothetical protein
MKSVAKALVVAVTALVVIVSNPLASHANGGGNHNKKASPTEEQVSVKYVGTENGRLVFNIVFDNPTGEKFALIIKNDAGDIVFHQQFNETHFAKNVYFENTDEDINPTFVIRSGNSNDIVRQFHVVKTITENTTVTSL